MPPENTGVFEVPSGSLTTRCSLRISDAYRGGPRLYLATETITKHPGSKKDWSLNGEYNVELSATGVTVDRYTRGGLRTGLAGVDSRRSYVSDRADRLTRTEAWMLPTVVAIRDHGQPAMQAYLEGHLPMIRTVVSDHISAQAALRNRTADGLHEKAKSLTMDALRIHSINDNLLAADYSYKALAVALDRYGEITDKE